MVPEGWKSSTLGNIAQITSGGTPSKSEPRYWTNGSIPWIRTTEIQNCHLSLLDVQVFITEEGLKNSSAKLLPKGTILLAMIGQGKTRGQVALLHFKATTNQNSAAIILKSGYDAEFYYNFLRSRYKQIRSASNSAGQSNLSGALVKLIKVPVPPFPEQKKIAQILSTWDQAITATERLLENSQQRKKGLMQQLLTGKKRLPGFEGEFKAISLGAAATITMGTSPKSAAYNSIGDGLPLLQGNADIEGRRSKPRVFTSEVTKVCQPGDILLSVRAPVGSVAISHHDACIGRGICAIKAKNKNNQEFLYQWMLWYEPRWASLSQGSTFESVNSSDIKNLEIKLPEPTEQQAISHVLSVADRESELLENRLDQLKQEKKALMQQLLTGKRRVNVDTEAA